MGDENHTVIGILSLIILIFIGWLVYDKWIKTDYSKPWWTGTQTFRVCKVPYYDDSGCYRLPVTSDGERITRVSLPNGGYFDKIGSTTCHKAGDKSIGRFCEFFESGTRWDVLK